VNMSRETQLRSAPSTDSVLFLLGSLTFIATVLYLPQHIAFIFNRAWFYMHGDNVDVVGAAKEAVQTLAQSALSAATAAATAAGETAEGVAREL
jgi:hypothetical protein